MTEDTEQQRRRQARRQRDLREGRERLERLLDGFASGNPADSLEGVLEQTRGEEVAEQPWLIAGCSDGMGMHVTLAALQAGLLNRGVAVYWEPDALLRLEDDGTPVSEVHWARYQNALALEELAADRFDADLTVMQADMMMAPERGLKGDIKEEPPDFSEKVRREVENYRNSRPGQSDDVVFIDSVAFGKWISPREGEEPVEVPGVDFDGRVQSMKTKKYHVRGYEETLDTMGRNHGRLMEACREFGWLGERSLTGFFTWAGGSQTVEVLEGIYGRGSLGDAKIIAERDVAAFRLEHGLEHGEHAIVRLPAFLSAALMAIPGGGLFGLVSRRVLQEAGLYRDMHELSAEMLNRLTGSAWVRENPIAQVELDSAEALYLSEIADQVDVAHERIDEVWSEKAGDAKRDGLSLQESAEALEGLVPPGYPQLLRKFRPEDEGPEATRQSSVTVDSAMPVAESLIGQRRDLTDMLAREGIVGEVVGVTERLDKLGGVSGAADATLSLESVDFDEGTTHVHLKRRVGSDIRSRLTLSLGLKPERDDELRRLGDPAGAAEQVDDDVRRRYGLASGSTSSIGWYAAAASVAERALETAGARMNSPVEFNLVRVPEDSKTLTAYWVDGEGERLVVVDDRARAVMFVEEK